MNVGEFRQALTNFPQNMPVAVFFDRKVTVTEENGDRISGILTDYFDVETVKSGEEFCPQIGFLPIAVVTVAEES